MNPFFQILAPRAFSLVFAASVTGLAACSTGTKPGDTNVEEGSAKDKNPDMRDAPGQNTAPTVNNHQDSINALMDTAKVRNDAYERAQKTPNPAYKDNKENPEDHAGHNH
jgi:hypothetical protein